eukprot:520864-Rhodomonas_salina.1
MAAASDLPIRWPSEGFTSRSWQQSHRCQSQTSQRECVGQWRGLRLPAPQRQSALPLTYVRCTSSGPSKGASATSWGWTREWR